MITSGLTECAICWSSCSLFLQDWKFMFTMRRGLLKALGRMVCRVLLNELDRSTGVVLNREEEKL